MKNKYIIAPGIAVICSAVISSGYASSDKKKIRLLLLPPASLSNSEMHRPVFQSLLQSNCKKNRFQTGRCGKKMLKGLVSPVGMKNRISVYVG